MQWFGKAVGGIIGFVDGRSRRLRARSASRSSARRARRAAARRRPSRCSEISQLFFEVAFEVMGQIAKIDGRVSEDEMRVARAIMHGMRLSPEQVRERDRAFHSRQERELFDRRERLGAARTADRRSRRARARIRADSTAGGDRRRADRTREAAAAMARRERAAREPRRARADRVARARSRAAPEQRSAAQRGGRRSSKRIACSASRRTRATTTSRRPIAGS